MRGFRPIRALFARELVVPVALAALAMVAAPRAAVADELSPYGVNVHAPAGAQLAAQLDRVERGGMGWVRVDFIWAAVQPARGTYDWRLYDALVAAAEQRGLSILAIIAYTPGWATDGAEISGVPRSVDDWTTFCTKAANRYKGRIAAWEVWNEPNLAKFWAGSRQQWWSQILIPGADAIHAADPQALVAGPALAHIGSRDWHHWLLETLQTAGNRIDVVTHHLYDGDGFSDVTEKLDGSTQFGNNPSLWSLVAPSVREVLKQANARSKPFWLTETGWESDAVGEATQADDYAGLLGQWFAGHATRNWVKKIFFYELQDGSSDFSWGVVRPNGTLKPAYATYRDFAADHAPGLPLVLQDGRYEARVTWRKPDGQIGTGTPLPYSRESGRFWFFGAGNTELVVKVLDGSIVNGHVWVYRGALSDVEYWLTVTDKLTGAVRRYHNAPGTFCGDADTRAFATGSSAAPAAILLAGEAPAIVEPFSPAAPPLAFASTSALVGADATCAAGPDALCLTGNRFRVTGTWRLPSGANGAAHAVASEADSGSFWFFGPNNLELVVKVLDGRPINGHFWVYFGALSDVEYWVNVTDTTNGATRTYHNAPGTLCGRADSGAF